MNKNIIGLLLGIIMLLSVGSVHAALSVGAWIDNNSTILSINSGESTQFTYGVTAVTSLGGKYSIMLYRDGSTAPIYTYANQPTVGNSALGTITVLPAHYENTAGSYHVLITSEDTIGRDTYRLNLNVASVQPIPVTATCASTPNTGYSPLGVQFSSTATGGSGTYTYLWTFGDGANSANSVAVTHGYSTGTYNPTLTVSDANNNNNKATVNCGQIVATTEPPKPAELKTTCAASPLSGTAPLDVAFTSQTSGGTTPYRYEWNFGDETTQKNNYPNIAAYRYSKQGVYATSLRVYDATNQFADANCGIITVASAEAPLSATCSANPTSGTSPLSVRLTTQVSGGSGSYTYSWTLGDGYTSANPIFATHVYSDGTYSPTVKITDSANANNYITINCGTITVNKPTVPLKVTCSANPTSGNNPLNVNFNSQVSGGTGPYTFTWTFEDGATSNSQNSASHTYTTAGTYYPTLKVVDSATNTNTYITGCTDANGISVIKSTPILNIDSITCFPRVTDGKNQSCSVFVKSSDGQIAGNVNINIYYVDGTSFGSCVTDRLSGGCEVEKVVHGVGTYTVYATANAQGFTGDNDKNPKYTFEVFAQRYNIINLGTYNDSNFYYPDDTFYRGEPLYAKFQVYDPVTSTFMTNDIVTAAALVSLPGGRVDLSRLTYSGNWYYYKLDAIPLTHDFLGGSNVFAFAFNFTGLTSGQAQIGLTILNNKPTISKIADVYVKIGQSYSVLLNNYGTDLEDHTLRWVITSTPSLFTANLLSGNVLSITGVTAGDSTVTLRGYDLDNDYADTTIYVHVLPNVIPNNLTATCSVNPNNGNAPLIVTANGQTQNGVGTLAYQYSFGDGAVVSHNQNSLAHTYNAAGVYSVSLIVTDSNNHMASANCGVVTVSNAPPVNYTLNVACIAMPDNGIIPLNVMFTSVVTNGVGPYTYVNDYGMGYTTTSHSNVAYQTYITPGTYHPSVTVTDSQGHSGNAQCGLIVANDIPKPTLSANAGGPYFGYVNEILTLDASRSTGNITAYTWNFGDGTGAYSTTSPTIQYTYTKTGIYNVELQVIDGSGNTATAYTTATINGKNDDNSDEKIVPDKGILIQHLLIYGQDGEILRPNENMMTQITLKSEWTSKLKSVRIIVSIPELGLETRSSLFDMSVNSVHSESLALPLDGVKPGVYYVRISVDNDQGKDQVRRIKYREIIVKDSTGCQTNCQG